MNHAINLKLLAWLDCSPLAVLAGGGSCAKRCEKLQEQGRHGIGA
jgi:hypothetical protein